MAEIVAEVRGVTDSDTAIERYNPGGELSVQQVRDQIHKIQDLMRDAMVESRPAIPAKDGQPEQPAIDGHFGIIPGVSKKSLLKAGAEKLCLLFRLDPEYEILIGQTVVDDTPQGGTIRYVIRCILYHIGTGNRVGSAIGSCSSKEEKYGWRNAQRKCPQCGMATIFESKLAKQPGFYCWKKKDGCGATFQPADERILSQTVGKVPNNNIWEQENTILKMAEKRALVAAVLNATAASDIFTQDIEDSVESTPIQAKVELRWYHNHLYRSDVEFHDLTHGSADYCPACKNSAPVGTEAGSKSPLPTPPVAPQPSSQPGDDLHLTAQDVPESAQNEAASPATGEKGTLVPPEIPQTKKRGRPPGPATDIGPFMEHMERAKKDFPDGVGEEKYRGILRGLGFENKAAVKSKAGRDKVLRKMIETFQDMKMAAAAPDAWTAQMMALADKNPAAFKEKMDSLGYRSANAIPVEYRLGALEAMRLAVR